MKNNWLHYDPKMDELTDKTQTLLEKAVQTTKQFIQINPKLSGTRYHTRGAHAKSYAYVKATFSPNHSLIKELKLGEFFYDRQQLTLRFSNANNVIDSSKKNFPAYGMSLKFENDINYPLVNFPLFPTDDVDSFLQLFIDLNQARIAQATEGWQAIKELPSLMVSSLKAFYHINPLDLGNLLWKGATLDQDFLMNYAYHGIGCYRLGDYVAKIHTEKNDFKFIDDISTSNLQKENLERILERETISFDLYVQLAVDNKTTPINQLTKTWDKSDSPWLTLGSIHIPRQQVKENTFALENLSFNPFLNPVLLQPVGRIQQTRRPVYEISANTRQKLNGNKAYI